ncbi:phosphotransferase family protein [Cohnella sp. JJ-181]|uniref:phosphotransferase family protein n=1 Tax=Cohnella rhizoplanae TaxID=2974897 RepID=UPI0022FF89CD|nr:aminoglycoside phosphotransferase family protein [Cohnella sp. JJ-181]CAI6086999.1 hypothetical protein COHCIP112018_05277 [Cohnella sp. JJ-181]
MLPIKVDEVPNEIIDHLGTIIDIRFPRQGHTSDVGIVEGAKGRFVLKRAKGEQYCSWLSNEVRVLKQLNNTPLPVPEVYRFVEQTEEKQSWVLSEFFEGETLREALPKEKNKKKKEEMIFSFGVVLAQIHSTPCPKGMVWDSVWLEEMLRRAEFNLKHYSVDGTPDLLKEIKANKPSPVKNTLIHGDFTIDNVIFHNGKVTSVIDWSGGAFGDPRYDLSLAIRPKPNAIETNSEIEVFFEGYGKKRLDEQEYKYFENGLYAFF